MRVLPARRPEVALLAALLVLAAALLWRGVQPEAESLAVDMAGPAPRPVGLGEPNAIARLRERLRRDPADSAAAAWLGLALLQRARETADPALYGQAEQALDAALQRDPEQLDALIGQGVLALARHQFTEALGWGERARAVAPGRAAVYGVLTDAYVELGRYDEALAAAQRMLDIRPDIDSYSRASYLRELHGDVPGAAEMMALAAEAGAPDAENSAWAYVQLGNLQLAAGNLEAATASYRAALAGRPGYAHAEVGLARVDAAHGRLAEAIQGYEAVVARLPLAEHAIALGDLYAAAGRPKDAERQRGLVRAMQALNAAAGMDVDAELALFDADHGDDPAATLALARAAYERHPSVVSADALAWALHRAGDSAAAARTSAEALRLGWRDPAARLRAGLIAAANGDDLAAREHLSIALAGAAALGPLRAEQAREALDGLSAGQ